MTALIQILDSQAANQIAAGEVVERPVSVVKELVENALDAGAQHIEITIEGSGVDLIRVRDDGLGISPQDLPRAVLRHATSKIRKIEDLNDLQTLGFRGEALPSIASVSKMEILTRPKDEISGMLLRLEGGKQVDLKEAGCPPGTTITIEDLFFNTPARRKFLKSTNTEFGLISDVVGRLSLARPDVAFTLKHPKVVVLQTPGRGRLIESIAAVIGQTTARRVLPVNFSRNQWSVSGYISPPDLVRSSRQGETLIVNGRIIRSNLISRAILEGYHTLIPHKLYPIVILNLQIPPHEYDVNVHPTKMEIRFHHEKELAEFISEGIRQVLLGNRPLASFEKGNNTQYQSINPSENPEKTKDRTKEISTQYAFKFNPTHASHPALDSTSIIPPNAKSNINNESRKANSPYSCSTISSQEKSDSTASTPLLTLSESSSTGSNKSSSQTSLINQVNTSDLKLECSPLIESNIDKDAIPQPEDSSLPVDHEPSPPVVDHETQNPILNLRPLGQVFKTYILTTDGEHLVILDQHAAHERINYERLLREHRANPGYSQALLMPIPLEFTPAEEQALLEHILLLHEMGFILEQFGTRTYLLRGIPAYSGPYQGEKLLRNFLDEVLSKETPPTFDKLLEEWIYMLACKDSIKAKEALSLLEMEQLLIQLSKTENPFTCPHGRPTMVKLTREELERRFYRT